MTGQFYNSNAQCVLCSVYFSAALNKLRPILKFKKYYPICGLQEHFKNSRSLMSYFKSSFPSYETSLKAAFREEERDTGRAKGGLAQLNCKGLKIKRSAVITKSWRLQAQILHFQDYKLLWLNVYFPTDPQVLNFDEAELLVVQQEVEELLEAGGYDDCLCGGDWNYDERRNSGFARSMQQFLSRVGLRSVWEKHAIDFTHVHTDEKSTSVLDNFYVSERLLEYVESATAVHLGDNLSRHSPIMLSLHLGDLPKKKGDVEKPVCAPRRLAWDKVESEKVQEYLALLSEELRVLEPPASLDCANVNCSDPLHLEERDTFLLDVMSKVIESSHRVIPSRPAPKKKASTHCRLPGWNETVKPLKKEAKFWYSVWLSAGRPLSNALHSVMINTRVKYRCAVRKAQQLANNQKAQSLLEAAEHGDISILKQMRRVMGDRKSPQELPASLEGEYEEKAIVEKFGSLYKELYNSCSTDEDMKELSAELLKGVDCRAEGEVAKVTGSVVRSACRRMNPGRTDVTLAYSSDVFLHSPPLLHDQLASIFRSFLVHGTVPLAILTCSFLPLLKPGKNPDKFDSYRAIAGASQVLKLFEYVILEVWGHCLGSDSLQFGYKGGTGADQCTWLMLTTAEYFKQRGSDTLCCLLDVTKGFDRVKFYTLFSTLLTRLPHVVVRVLMFTYMKQEGFVKLGGQQSSSFGIKNGTRQGAVASPVLWAVYVNNLLVELRQERLGCFVSGIYMGAFMYVDDLALLAPTRSVLAEMLKVVENYGLPQSEVLHKCQPKPLQVQVCLLCRSEATVSIATTSPEALWKTASLG